MSVISYDRIYSIRAWADNNMKFTLTQGEGLYDTPEENTCVKYIKFRLYDEAGEINLPTLNVAVYLVVKRPDGITRSFKCLIDYETQIISCPISREISIAAGKVRGEIQIISPNAVMKFYGVDFCVKESTILTVESEVKDDDAVVFWDTATGEPAYSFNLEEINLVNKLPPLPSHDGLTCTGWNWTLEDIVSTVNSGETVDVGSYFITNDKKTHLYFEFTEDMSEEFEVNGNTVRGVEVAFVFRQSNANDVSFDWGDGSELETTDAIYNSSIGYPVSYKISHIFYPSSYPARYTVKMYQDPDEGSYGFGARWSRGMFYNNIHKNAQNSIYRIELAENAFISYVEELRYGYYLQILTGGSDNIKTDIATFADCHNLKCITPSVSSGIGYWSSGSEGHFESCFNLKAICYSKSTGTYDDMKGDLCRDTFIKRFNNMSKLQRLSYDCFRNTHIRKATLQECTAIHDYAFANCYQLEEVTGLNNCTHIMANAFAYCYNLKLFPELTSCIYISGRAFEMCHNLRAISFPVIQEIGYRAFLGCTSLESLVIPGSATSIGEEIVYDCGNIKSIKLGCSDECVINKGAFKTSYNSNNRTKLEYVDLTSFDGAIPTLSYSFLNTFTTENDSGRKVKFYVKDNNMKSVFSNATNWSDGADYYIVGTPPTSE